MIRDSERNRAWAGEAAGECGASVERNAALCIGEGGGGRIPRCLLSVCLTHPAGVQSSMGEEGRARDQRCRATSGNCRPFRWNGREAGCGLESSEICGDRRADEACNDGADRAGPHD